MAAFGALFRRIDAPLLAAAIATSGLKVVSAALNYALLILLARIMTVEAFGLYGILFSAATLIAAFIFCGQPVLVLKSIPEYVARNDPARQKGVVFFGAAVLLVTSALFIVLLLAGHASGRLPAYLSDGRVLLAFALLTVVYALSDYSCNVLRALGFTYSGLVPRDILWRLAAIIGLLLAGGGGTVGIFEVLGALGGLLAILVAWQFWRIWRIIVATLPVAPAYDARRWRAASVWMAIGSLLFTVSLTLDTVIVGALMGADDAAVYFAAARTAAISSLLLVGLRLIAAPVFARLHSAEAHEDLRSRIEMVYGLSAATSAVFAIVGFVFAPQIMRVFGAGFEAGVEPFRILLIGLSVATAGGMSSSILESTGGERLNAVVLIFTQTLTALAVAVCAASFGLYGASLAKATGVALEAILLSACVFRRLGRRPTSHNGITS